MLRKATADDLPALTALRCGAAKANPVDAAGWLQNVAGLENILVLEKNGQSAAMLAAVPVKYGQHRGVWLCGAAGVQGRADGSPAAQNHGGLSACLRGQRV